jgi:hypothetical protein
VLQAFLAKTPVTVFCCKLFPNILASGPSERLVAKLLFCSRLTVRCFL